MATRIFILFLAAFGLSRAARADATIQLGDKQRVTDLYSFPNNCNSVCYRPWTLEQTVEHYLNDSLRREGSRMPRRWSASMAVLTSLS